MLKASFKIGIILFSSHSMGHSPPSNLASVDGSAYTRSNTLSNGIVYGDTTGGYGYLCSTPKCSEAEAVNMLDLNCDDNNPLEYLAGLCEVPGLDLASNPDVVKNLSEISEVTFKKHLQASLYEYLKLSDASNPYRINEELKKIKKKPVDGVSVEMYQEDSDDSLSCIKDLDQYSTLKNTSINVTSFGEKNIFNSFNRFDFLDVETSGRPIEEKANSLNKRFHPENIARALTYRKFLDYWETVKTEQENPDMYKSIQEQKKKITQSYPNLFDEKGDYLPESNKILDSIYSALGSTSKRVNKWSLDLAGTKNIGEEIFKQKTKSSSLAYPSILKELFENINYIGELAKNNKDPNSQENSFFKDIDKQINKLGEKFLDKEKEDKDKVCDLGISEISERYPNVVRQALLELEGKNLDMAKFVMCDQGIAKDFSNPTSCGKSRGKLHRPKGENFEIKSSYFPYGSSRGSKINVRILPDGTTVIKKKLQLVDKVGVSDKEKVCLSTRIKKAVETDFNCQVGAPGSDGSINVSPVADALCSDRQVADDSSKSFERECPTPPNQKRDPGVKFELEIDFIPKGKKAKGRDVINIYQCYRSEIPEIEKRGDCDEVKKYNTQACVLSKGVGHGSCYKIEPSVDDYEVKLEECCKKDVSKRVDEGDLLRENAANMTTGSARGVWYHEILHTMGLDDEYPEGTYPMSDLGDEQSIMRKARSNQAVLYPRHVDQILKRVRQCQ